MVYSWKITTIKYQTPQLLQPQRRNAVVFLAILTRIQNRHHIRSSSIGKHKIKCTHIVCHFITLTVLYCSVEWELYSISEGTCCVRTQFNSSPVLTKGSFRPAHFGSAQLGLSAFTLTPARYIPLPFWFLFFGGTEQRPTCAVTTQSRTLFG